MNSLRVRVRESRIDLQLRNQLIKEGHDDILLLAQARLLGQAPPPTPLRFYQR
jgi:hypothetical protein